MFSLSMSAVAWVVPVVPTGDSSKYKFGVEISTSFWNLSLIWAEHFESMKVLSTLWIWRKSSQSFVLAQLRTESCAAGWYVLRHGAKMLWTAAQFQLNGMRWAGLDRACLGGSCGYPPSSCTVLGQAACSTAAALPPGVMPLYWCQLGPEISA